MRLLLDTHVLLWALVEPLRLDRGTRALIENTDNQIAFSAASNWEIAITAGLRRGDFSFRPEESAEAARSTGFIELPIRAQAAALVMELPKHHRDPFDRLLVAQAMIEPMRLYTADPQLLP